MSIKVIDVSPEEWADRHGILQREMKCPGCQSTYRLDVPIAIKGHRGLAMSEHGCGPGSVITVVPVDSEKIAIFEKLRPEGF